MNNNGVSKRSRGNRKNRGQQRQQQPSATINIRPAAATNRPKPRPRNNARNNRSSNGDNFLSTIGAGVGSIFGPTGAMIGRGIGGGLARITGLGDYQISQPVAQNSLAGQTPPMFGNSTGATRIRHREFIGDIYSSTNFQVRSYPLTPGIPTLFPWLSHIAANYEQYRFRGLVVEFKSTSASALNSTNTALGVVGLATQYDAAEPDFVSKQEAENYIGAQSCNPSNSLLHFVECAPGQNPLNLMYVRTGVLPTNQDVKFYDLGKVQLFTQGMQQANVNIGELWVSYEIEFAKPKVPAGGDNQTAPIDWYTNTAVGYQNIYLSGKISGVPDLPTYGNLGTSITNNTLTIPANASRGRYLFALWGYLISGSSAGATTGSLSYNNCNQANIFQSTTGTYIPYLQTGIGSAVPCFVFAFDVLQSGAATVTLTGFDLQGSANDQFNLSILVTALKNNDVAPTQNQNEQLAAQFEKMLFDYGLDLSVLRKMTHSLHDEQEQEILREKPPVQEVSYDQL